jgi:NADH-quinone oxidoreductase subunit D
MSSRIKSDVIELNMGPQHPSTHGVLRIDTKLDGEVVVQAKPDVGYLHRGVEKLAELRSYIQFIPVTDRLDYLSSMMQNAAFCYAIEKLGQIEVSERAEYIRVIMMELQRIASHLIYYGTMALDLGATSPFLYSFREREDIVDLFEMTCGARLTYNYFRPGGVAADLPDGFYAKAKAYIKKQRERLPEYDDILTNNQIFIARTRGIGIMDAKDVVNYSLSGPSIRGSGVAYDVRRADPYSVYHKLDWDVVTYPQGDVWARYMVRVDEIRQSLRIVEQALDMMPAEPVSYKLPARLKLPVGEIYHRIESSRGEVGVYIVSDGSDKPYRMHWRAPSFINLGALDKMCKGYKLADIVAILGSLDVVLGEVDR